MNQQRRTPFILQLLKLPLWIITFLLYLVGVPACLPLSVYSLLITPLIFNSKFDTSKTFYIVYWLPRALAAFGIVVLASGELYSIYWLVSKFIKFSTGFELIITEISVLIFTVVSFTFGIKFLKEKLGLSYLRNPKDYLWIVFYGLQDIISSILTLLTILLVFRIKELLDFKFEPNRRTYLRFVTSKFIESLLDLICLPFWAIITITVWRLFYTRRVIQRMKPGGRKRLFVVYQGISAILDVLFIPLLLVSLFNPYLKARRAIYHMSKLSVVTWRKIIIDEFISTLFDIIPFASLLISACIIYELPLAAKLYIATIKKCKPFEFVDEENAFLQIENDNKDDDEAQQQMKLYEKVATHNEVQELQYRSRSFMLLFLIFVDLIILIANLLLILSIYRYIILQKRIKARRSALEQDENNQKKRWEALSYNEYRCYIYDVFQMDIQIEETAPKFSTYPGMVILEALKIILDIPFIALSPILVLVPWRALQIIKAAQLKWQKLEEIRDSSHDESLRLYLFNAIITGLFDWICIALFIITLIAPWRVNEAYSLLKTNLNSRISEIEYSPAGFVCLTLNIIIDILFIPLLLIALLNPFLKGKRLVNHMKMLPASTWKRLILREFCSALLDIPSFLCLLFSMATIYEIPVALTLYRATLHKIYSFTETDIENGLQDQNEMTQILVQEETSLYRKVAVHNAAQNKGYRSKYFLLATLIFVDVLVFLGNALLLISIFRYIVLQRKIKTRREELEMLENNQKEKHEALSHSEYRDYIDFILSLQAENEQDASIYSTYPSMILSEVCRLVFDLLILALSPFFIIFPWRARYVIRAAQLEWKRLGEIQPFQQGTSVHCLALIELILGLIDYVYFMFFLMSLIGFWRYPYMIAEIKNIYRANYSGFSKQRSNAFDYFTTQILAVVLVDLLYLPLVLILLPFYCVCFWRLNLLKDCLKAMKKDEFSGHRTVIFEIGLICIGDFLRFIPLAFTAITLYRLPTLRRMLRTGKHEKVKSEGIQEMPLQVVLLEERNQHMELKDEKEPAYAPPILNYDEEGNAIDQAEVDNQDICPNKEQEMLLKSPNNEIEHNEAFELVKSEIQESSQEESLHLQSLLAQHEMEQTQIQLDIDQEQYNAIEPQITYKTILAQRRYIALFDASLKCGVLLFLDVLGLPFLAIIYLNCNLIGQYNEKLKRLQTERGQVFGVAEHYNIEFKACMSKFEAGFKSFGILLFKIFFVIAFSVLLWRSPTLLILIAKSELQDRLYFVPIENDDQDQQPKIKRKFGEYIWELIRFCISQLITDVIYVPFFIALAVITPWRLWPVLKAAYKYDDPSSIDEQIDEQRSLVISQFGKGLLDILIFLQLILIIITLLRIPFLVIIIKKNRHLRDKQPNNDILNEVNFKTRLPVRKCISMTCNELLKDICYIPFAILLLLIAPWRIFSLYYIFLSQFNRVPTHNVGKNYFDSRRSDIPSMICSVLIVDYINIFKLAIAVLAIYKIFSIFRLIIHYIFNSGRYESGELSFSGEVHRIYKEARKGLFNVLFSLMIIVCVFRVPRAYRRLANYHKNLKQKKSIKMKQNQQKTLNSLTGLDWKIYNRLSQFLTVQDLARLSQVNKDLYKMNQNDAYWQYQADRDWIDQRRWNNEITYKEKCIRAVQEENERKLGKLLDQDQLDGLYGENYILFDEAVNSVLEIPQILLFPAKALGSLILCFMGKNIKFSQFIPKRSPEFIDVFRGYFSHSERMQSCIPNFEECNTFRKIHYVLSGWVLLILSKYVCEMGYLLSYICCFIVKVTSAGEVSPVEVNTNDATGEHTMNPTKKKEELSHIENRFAAFFMYLVQLCFICIDILLLIAGFAAPALALIYFKGWEVDQAIFGPCFVFIVHYCTLINVIITQSWYIAKAAPYFRPYRALTELISFLWFVVKEICSYLGKVLIQIAAGLRIIARALAKFVLFVWNSLVQGLQLIGKGIKILVLFLYKQIVALFTGIWNGYTAILVGVTNALLKCGMIGDILLTLFALLWMLWPLAIPLLISKSIYFIPCGLFSLILIFVGYKKIQQTQNPKSQNNN